MYTFLHPVYWHLCILRLESGLVSIRDSFTGERVCTAVSVMGRPLKAACGIRSKTLGCVENRPITSGELGGVNVDLATKCNAKGSLPGLARLGECSCEWSALLSQDIVLDAELRLTLSKCLSLISRLASPPSLVSESESSAVSTLESE